MNISCNQNRVYCNALTLCHHTICTTLGKKLNALCLRRHLGQLRLSLRSKVSQSNRSDTQTLLMSEEESAKKATNARLPSDAVHLRVCSPDSSSSHFESGGETPLSAIQCFSTGQVPSTPAALVFHTRNR